MKPFATRTVAATIAVTGLASLATACGGSPSDQVARLASTTTQAGTSAGTPAASTALSRAVAYARCMRSHGVPKWPDPDSSGVFDKSKLTAQRLGVGPSRIEAAQTGCRNLTPNGGRPPNQVQQQQIKAQALRFSRCVRAHGVPNFPDPGSDGRIPDPATVGIDQGSPRFLAANQACGKYRPPYLPSNAAYNAWARTHAGG